MLYDKGLPPKFSLGSSWKMSKSLVGAVAMETMEGLIYEHPNPPCHQFPIADCRGSNLSLLGEALW